MHGNWEDKKQETFFQFHARVRFMGFMSQHISVFLNEEELAWPISRFLSSTDTE